MPNIFTDIPAFYSVEALLPWAVGAFGLTVIIGIVYRVAARRRLVVLVRKWGERNADKEIIAHRKRHGFEAPPKPVILDIWDYMVRIIGIGALAAAVVTVIPFIALRVAWQDASADTLGSWFKESYNIDISQQQAWDLRWNQDEPVAVVYEGKAVAVSLLNVEGEEYVYGAPSKWIVVYHTDAVPLDELDR